MMLSGMISEIFFKSSSGKDFIRIKNINRKKINYFPFK
jgi:hypothetical protein